MYKYNLKGEKVPVENYANPVVENFDFNDEKNKKWLWVALAVVVALLLAYAAYWYFYVRQSGSATMSSFGCGMEPDRIKNFGFRFY